MRHVADMERRVSTLVEERGRVTAGLAELGVAASRRFRLAPTSSSCASTATTPTTSGNACSMRGVLVRDCSGWPRLDGCLRVTIGLPAENDRFLAALGVAVAAPERRADAVDGDRMRTASRERATKETRVAVNVDLDGTGRTDVVTGIPFYDHMLDQLGRHSGFDLTVHAEGDLHIDTHHTVEDVAITLGEAFAEAVGDKAGVRRFASGLYPLDEALVEVALDLSGRPFVAWDVPMPESLPLGNPAFDPQLAEHAVSSFATNAAITLHVTLRAGRNAHHIIEATFKGVARCLRDAVRVDAAGGGVPVDEGRAVTECPPVIAVVDYGIGNLHSAQKALARLGADARLTDDPARDRRRRRRRPPRRRSFGACMDALRRPPARGPRRSMRRRRAGRSSGSASACRCCSAPARRVPVWPGSGSSRASSAGSRATSRSRRCNGTSSTMRVPTIRCSPASADGRGSTSSTRCTGFPTIRRRSDGDLRVRVDVERRVPRRIRSPPCSSIRRSRHRGAWRCSATSSGTSPRLASVPPSS